MCTTSFSVLNVSVLVCVLCVCMCAETRSWGPMSSSVVPSPYCVLTLTCLVRLDIFHVHKQVCMSTFVRTRMGVFDMSFTPALSLSIALWNFVGQPLSSWLMSFCPSPRPLWGDVWCPAVTVPRALWGDFSDSGDVTSLLKMENAYQMYITITYKRSEFSGECIRTRHVRASVS